MNADHASTLIEKVAACRVIADRLERTASSLARVFPITEDRIASLDDATVQAIDAMLLRFTNLVSNLQDHVFRLIVIVEERDPTVMTNRDRARFMEKVGVLSSSDSFSTAVLLRNKLAHQYPGDSTRQAELLNETWKSIPTVLEIHANAERFLAERGHLRRK